MTRRPLAFRPRGLTLVELMIALGVLAVLCSLAAPSLSGWIARNRVQAAAAHLVADLAEARHEATRRGQPLRVNFQPGSAWCYAITLDPQAGCASPTASVLKRVQADDHPGVQLLMADAVDFDDRTGTVRQPVARMQLQSAQGHLLQVTLSRLGRASVCAPRGAVPGVPACPVLPLPPPG